METVVSIIGKRMFLSGFARTGRPVAAETVFGLSAVSEQKISLDFTGDRSKCLADVGGGRAVSEEKRMPGKRSLGGMFLESGKTDPFHAGAGTPGNFLCGPQYESVPFGSEGTHVSVEGWETSGSGQSQRTLYEYYRIVPGQRRTIVFPGIFLGKMLLYILDGLYEISEKAASFSGKLAFQYFVLG